MFRVSGGVVGVELGIGSVDRNCLAIFDCPCLVTGVDGNGVFFVDMMRVGWRGEERRGKTRIYVPSLCQKGFANRLSVENESVARICSVI